MDSSGGILQFSADSQNFGNLSGLQIPGVEETSSASSMQIISGGGPGTSFGIIAASSQGTAAPAVNNTIINSANTTHFTPQLHLQQQQQSAMLDANQQQSQNTSDDGNVCDERIAAGTATVEVGGTPAEILLASLGELSSNASGGIPAIPVIVGSDGTLEAADGNLLNLDLIRNAMAAEAQAADWQEQRRVIRCEICDEKFKIFAVYKNHVKHCQHSKQYACTNCGESFNQLQNYNLHSHIHKERDENESMDCPICGKKFNRTAAFKCHISLHQTDDMAVCGVCQDEYAFYTQLKKHVREVHCQLEEANGGDGAQISSLVCKECGTLCDSPRDLKQHKITHQVVKESLRISNKKRKRVGRPSAGARKRGKTYKCNVCAKFLSSHSALNRHLVTHTGERPFKCEFPGCGKTFNQRGSLMFHENIHLEKKPFPCQLCDASFAQRGNLRKHVQRLHTAREGPTYKCPICNSCSFKNIQALNVHLGKRHGAAIDFDNSQDAASFVQAAANNSGSDSNMLMQLLAANGLDSVDAATSSGGASRPSDLLSDALAASGLDDAAVAGVLGNSNATATASTQGETLIETAPGLGGRQLAAISQKLLRKASDLLNERRGPQTNDSFYASQLAGANVRIENGKKIWSCPACPKQFTRGSDLVRHSRRHTGEKPYTCSMCGKAYSLRSTLQHHLRSHLGLKAVRCHVCLKQLASANSLRKHMKLHNRQFCCCLLCDRSFRDQQRLSAHVQRAHPPAADALDQQTGEQMVPAVAAGLLFQEPLVETEDGVLVQPDSDAAGRLSDTHRQFTCNRCPNVYKRLNHLMEHTRAAHSSSRFVCNYCGRAFRRHRYMKTHLLSAHCGVNKYACSQEGCRKRFPTSGARRRHEVVHTDFRPFVCPYCSKRWKLKGKCRAHIKTAHRDLAMQPQAMQASAAALAEEAPMHDRQQAEHGYGLRAFPRRVNTDGVELLPSASNELQPSAAGVATMAPAQAADGEAAVGDFQSLMGEVMLGAASALPQAQPVPQQQPVPARFGCQACGEEFGAILPFVVHLHNVHMRSSQFGLRILYVCPVCKQDCKGSKRMIAHLIEAHLDAQDRAQLDPVISLASLEQHDSIGDAPHQPQDPLAAMLAEANVSANHSMSAADTSQQQHFNMADVYHLGKGQKQCPICNRKFSKNSDCLRHMRIHTGEKPYACNICERTFRVKSTLTSHMRVHETPPTDPVSGGLQCSVCSGLFWSRSSLKVHMRVHTNEKPYECAQCGDCFRTSGHLKQHQERVHDRAARNELDAQSQEAEGAVASLAQPSESGSLMAMPAEHYPMAGLPFDGNNMGGVPEITRLLLNVQKDPLQVCVRPAVGAPGEDAQDTIPIELSTLAELVKQGMMLNIPLHGAEYAPGAHVSVDPANLLDTYRGSQFNQAQQSIGGDQRVQSAETDFNSYFDQPPAAMQPHSANQHAANAVLGVAYPPEDSYVIECIVCGVQFQSAQDSHHHFSSADHETAVHNASAGIMPKQFACRYCVKSFDHVSKLERHLRAHAHASETCPHCRKKFTQRESLKRHINIVHSTEKRFTCVCGKAFQTKSNLARHGKICHEANAPSTDTFQPPQLLSL